MDRKNRKLHKNHLYSNGTGYKNVSAAKHNKLKQLIDQILDLGYQNPISADDEWTQYIEMRALISNVQLIEKEICPTSSNSSGQSYSQKNRKQCIDTFLNWAKENGAKFDGVTLTEFSGYELGLQATRDFKKDELYITIPKKIIMTLDNVNEIVIPLINELPMIESMLNVKLALSLLVEKLSPRSFWKPYIDVLPEKFPTVMTFKIMDMLELKASCLLHSALMQCKHIFRQYAFIKKHLINCIKDEKLNPLLVVLKERFTFDLYW